METLGVVIFVIWFVAQIISDERKAKQRRQSRGQQLPPGFPMPGRGPQGGTQERGRGAQSPIDFEIPPIAGAPGRTSEYPLPYEGGEWEEEPISDAEEDRAREWAQAAEAPRPERTVAEELPSKKRQPQNRLPLLRNPETAREAVLYAEIFGKPKAMRRGRR